MTDKELQKLNRRELLEMLIVQTKEVERLQAELDETREKLESRDLMVEKAGSFAQAAFEINGVVESVEAAAAQYLENLKRYGESQKMKYNAILEEARRRATEILTSARAEASALRGSPVGYELEETEPESEE